MAQKLIGWKTKGMNRDMSVSAFNPEFAFENINVRLSTNESNTTMSWVNERGTEKLKLKIDPTPWKTKKEREGEDYSYQNYINGSPVGTAVLNHRLVLFTVDNLDYCYIYVFEMQKDPEGKVYMYGKQLVSQKLGFSTDSPIETLVSYESESIQKVYWIDRNHQPRMINVAPYMDSKTKNYNEGSFDFVRTLSLKEEVNVTKIIGSGEFPSGVIQYAFTYYNKYGQESSIFYVTPLQCISFKNRGGNPEEKVANSFKITLFNIDRNFDYLRIYSILRTSVNAMPYVKRVQDIQITEDTITYVDTGLSGDTVDPTELLYKGGEEIRVNTLEQKDDTLFFGGIKTMRSALPAEIRKSLTPNVVVENKNELSEEEKKTKSVLINTVARSFQGKIVSIGDLAYVNTIDYSGFKTREYYRIGIQFQYKTGKWSEPLWLKDYRIQQIKTSSEDSGGIHPILNTVPCIDEATGIVTLPQIQVKLFNTKNNAENKGNLDILIHEGYKRARLLMAQPSESDRTIICQGIANSCLYQETKRFETKAGVLDKDGNIKLEVNKNSLGTLYGQSSWLFRPWCPDTLHTNTTTTDGGGFVTAEGGVRNITDLNYFRINGKDLFSPGLRSAEIGVDLNEGYFAIDHNMLTIHSPELIFSDDFYSMDWENTKLSNIGKAIFNVTYGDIDIQTSTPTIGSAPGFIHKSIKTSGNAALVSGLYYEDFLVDDIGSDTDVKYRKFKEMKVPVSFPVFMWHPDGSLNNDVQRDNSSAKLLKKRISNYHMSNVTRYYDNGNITTYTPLGVKYFNSDVLAIEKIENYLYMGNIETAVTSLKPNYKYFAGSPWREKRDTDFLSNCMFRLGLAKPGDESSKNGVWQLQKLDTGGYEWHPPYGNKQYVGNVVSSLCESSEPVKIKYKSTPHLVTMLDKSVNDVNIFKDAEHLPSLPMIEVVKDYNVNVLYGGQSVDALKANTWIPISNPVNLDVKGIVLESNQGDTYYQRFECLKTYAFTPEDLNQVVDIASFMCETHINIDGRYDRNRAQSSNLNASPKNFNLHNPVYSQMNNFFNYKIMDEDTYRSTEFPNTITWTKTKQSGADVDLWTNITMANTLELDGDKGEVHKLIKFNDQLLAFQDNGISQILYNENTQISTTKGVPIEIANSQKVQGKRYYSDTIGCSNKWSIAATPAGIYFIDNNTKGIYLFNGQVANLSITGGMNSWIQQHVLSSKNEWSPENFEDFVAYYDKLSQEVLFINDTIALAYSERFSCFTSFYDYGRIPYFCNLDDIGLWLLKDPQDSLHCSIWQHHAGKYCKFFGKNKPYSLTLIGNQDPQTDKIFTNMEFRACVEGEGIYEESNDRFIPDLPFDSLEVWNEYQHGILKLTNRNALDKFNHSHTDGETFLSRKFRMWRCDIPRDNAEINENEESKLGIKRFKPRVLDRIRNPWVYLKLKKEAASEDTSLSKVEIHDLIAKYFV